MQPKFSGASIRQAIVIASILLAGPASHGQIISTLTGDGTPAYTGDGAAASAARIKNPNDVTVDGSGNIYIADWGNHCVRKVTTSGIISTIAGTGSSGYSGDGFAATAARLYAPSSVAVDGAGNVYIAEYGNHRIRKVNTSGIITTIAGTGVSGYGGDGAAATAAQINHVYGVAVDGSGNVYIADAGNNRIRKVNTSGIITTVAGTGTFGFSGDAGQATDAKLNGAAGISVDAAGNMYIADTYNNRIRKVTASGIINSIAGLGAGGFGGDGGMATAAYLFNPFDVVLGSGGELYVADFMNKRVRKISSTGVISTIVGTGLSGYNGDGWAATAAQIGGPFGVAVDASGNVYVPDYGDNRVRMINTCPAAFIDTIAGGNAVCMGSVLHLSDAVTAGSWSSEDTFVATIGSGSGILTPVSPGTVTISYTVTNGCGTSLKTTSVTVNALPDAGAISGLDSICPGISITLTNTVFSGLWSSTNTAIATIGGFSGVVTGVSPGMDTIRYITTNVCGSDTAIHPFTVRAYSSICPNSVNDLTGEITSLQLSPNPSYGSFQLLFKSPVKEHVTITITNLLGVKVLGLQISSNEQRDLQLQVPAGIYIVTAVTKQQKMTEKLVIE